MKSLVIISLVGLLFIFPSLPVNAQVPRPAEVPTSIPAPERQPLNQRRAELFDHRDTIKANVLAHNKKCRGVRVDSPITEECKRGQKALRTEVDKYAANVRKFNTAVVEAGASIPLHEDSELPNIDRMLLGVQRIRVPPPIPPQDVAIDFGQLTTDNMTHFQQTVLEIGVGVFDVVYGLGRAAHPAKIIFATGKTVIAAADGADVYLVKQTELYEEASKYLKDSKTRLRFTELVRNIKANKPLPEDANVQMVRAAYAILDPKLGNSGTRIAWDAMFSPEASRAALTQACIELGGEVLGGSALKLARRVTAVQTPAYIKATKKLIKARKKLGKTKSPRARAKLQKVIYAANKKIENTFQTTDLGEKSEKTIESSLNIFFKYNEESFRTKNEH